MALNQEVVKDIRIRLITAIRTIAEAAEMTDDKGVRNSLVDIRRRLEMLDNHYIDLQDGRNPTRFEVRTDR